ncbi:MAG: hypothetical protein ACRDIB_09370 [Ardenticatenaceae bacterium]
MFQNRIPVWAVVAVGLLVVFGIASVTYDAGYSQGFTMGLLAGGSEGGAAAPYLAYGNGFGWNRGGFGFFPFLFGLFIFAMVARFFGFWGWRRHSPPGPWQHHEGHRRPGHGGPPWGRMEKPVEERPVPERPVEERAVEERPVEEKAERMSSTYL